MKKILTLGINFLLLIASDAVPLQLIAGDRSVVKKDGATHTISKYYVVPNDIDPNNVTNSTEASQTTLRITRLYSKSMDANTASEDQGSQKRAETRNDQTDKNNADVNNTEVNSRSDLSDAQVEVAPQANDNIFESTGTVNTEQSLDPVDLGNLQVEPITNSININSSVNINKINVYNSSEALQPGTSLIVENPTKTYERNVEDELDDLILTKFGMAVQESSVQNLESFWKVIKLTIGRISDDDELFAQVERLSLLLNIFTNLYEAAKLQKPIESMIDSIIDILLLPFVEKRNTSESQSQRDVSGDYDEVCLRKCGLQRSKPQLDSNGIYLSETESLEASDNLEPEKLNLKTRQRGDSDDDWVNTSNDSVSNEETLSNKLANILRNQSALLVPDNLNVPDGYNVRSLKPTPTLNHVTRYNFIQDDPQSNQIIPDSTETGKNTDDQPLTIKPRLIDDWPRSINERSGRNIPWTIHSTMTDDLPWHIEDKMTDNLPWHIEDKSIGHHPFKHGNTRTSPWTIKDVGTKKVTWNVDNRADPKWIIENKMVHSPITFYQSKDPSGIHGGKILLHPNQPMAGTLHGVKHGVKKPYRIYTYVINPATSIYEIPNLGNLVNVKSRPPSNDKLGKKLYGLPSSHGGNKIVYTNKPFPSYDGSQFSLSKPTLDISRPATNYVTSNYDKSNQVNPSTLISETPQDDYQPKYLVEYEPGTNHKPGLLQPNTLSIYSQTNSDQENEEPEVQEVGSYPGVLLLNVPSNLFESPVTTASASASVDTSNVNPDIGDTEPNPYNPNINLNHMQQTNSHPSLISKTSTHSEYTHLPDDYDEPSPVYGGETHKYPGLISTASSSSIKPDEYYEPVYGDQTHQHPGFISSSASSSSEYTTLSDDFDEPSPVYGGETHKYPHKHPGLISTASSSSAYTNLANEYGEPVYGDQTHQHPGLISSPASSNSEYTNLSDDYDEPSPVYGGETHKHPGLVSKASSSSAYTNLANEYGKPVYGDQTHQYPGLISSSASSNSEYTNLLDDYDEPSPVYGGETHKHPGLISTASSSSIKPDEYDEPVYGDQTHQHPGLISSPASSSSEYTTLSHDYDEPNPIYGGETHKHPGLISTASSSSAYTNLPDEYDEPVYGEQTHQHPGLISSPASFNSEYTNLSDDYDEPSPVYGGETHKHPGLISTASSSSTKPGEYNEPVYSDQTHQHPGFIHSTASSNSGYTNLLDDYDVPSPVYDGETHKHPGLISTASSSSIKPDEYDEPVYGDQTHQHPGFIPSTASSNSGYTNLLDDYDEPSPVDGGETHKHPGLISTASSSSAYTNLPDEYDEPVYGDQTHQHPGLISSSNSEYTNIADDYDEPSPVYGGQTHKYPGYISKASAHSKNTNLPNDYNYPIPSKDRHPGLITKVNHYPEYAYVVDDYDEPIPVYGEEINKHPGFLSKASSHSEYTNLPNDYNKLTDDYEEDTDRYPVHIQTPVNARPTENEDNLPVSYDSYGHPVDIIQPSLISNLHGNKPTGLNYLKHLKIKLAPTYRLFTLDNLLKLHNLVIKTIEVNSDKPDVYDIRALMNLRKIINLLLILAEHLEDAENSIEWYEKIFYNTQKNRHPLEIYVYNLIRQRWLHELMLVLHKNDFNFNILQNPRIFSFLRSWKFPHNILNFIEAETLTQHNFDAPEVFDQTFSTQHGLQDKSTHTYDDLLEDVPEDLNNYVTNNVINSYKTPNTGIVLSIAGVEAEPDANAIIHILQKYLHYKSFIEKQETVIIRDNKVKMLKQIITFLREKGYGAATISDLIRKLYTAVYSTEGKGCQPHHTNFAKNMYDVILPVLRRSGR